MKSKNNLNANIYTLSAVAVGYILLDESTPAEQNSLGNWFMLVGQFLETNASRLQVLNNRNNNVATKNSQIINDEENHDEINMLEKLVNAIQIEINNLKKGL